MGESMPQADTRRRTEGSRGEAEEARSASLPSWHQTPARPCGGKRVCSGPTDRVYLGDRSPTDIMSILFGQVACSIRIAPRVGPGRAPGQVGWLWATYRHRQPVRLTSGDGDSGTGLSVRAEDDGDRWGGIPRIHPIPSCESSPTRSVGGKLPSGAAKSTANPGGISSHLRICVMLVTRMC
jgi:hypothetical protein